MALAIVWSHEGTVGSCFTDGGYQETVLTNAGVSVE
jgi:hypothetical protein